MTRRPATRSPTDSPVRQRAPGRALRGLLPALMTLGLPAVFPHAAGAADPPPRASLPGQLSSRFAVDPANPEASIPSAQDRDRNPLEFGYLLQDLIEGAEQSRKAKDWSGVVRYYRAVAKAVPDNAKGWSKLCEAYEITNDRERAILACRYAIDRPAVELQDYVRYVHLIIGQAGPPGAEARQELSRVLAHLDAQPEVGAVASHLRCEVAIKLSDAAQLETCTRALAALAPNDPKTLVFQWTLAVMKGDKDRAKQLLVRARAAGVAPDGVARMEEATLSSSSFGLHGTTGLALAAAVAFALAGLAAFLLLRRRRRDLGPRRVAA